ncbi:MAG: iron-containing alcohol dehydrogenase, partial [Verrucomicrobiaceae bacterium]
MIQKPTLQEALQAARETRALVIGRDILHQTATVFKTEFGGRPAVPVCDETTFRVAGKTVWAAFQQSGQPCLDPIILRDPDLYAEYRFVEELEERLKHHNAIPVAVGSGTINDLTKLAAHRCERPYMCVATAASMDGYTAFGASITYLGSKQTFDCPAPTAVVADIEVIRHAPPDMTAAGYADLLAKITAGADWIVADALGVE